MNKDKPLKKSTYQKIINYVDDINDENKPKKNKSDSKLKKEFKKLEIDLMQPDDNMTKLPFGLEPLPRLIYV